MLGGCRSLGNRANPTFAALQLAKLDLAAMARRR
jgi:hypothetical protein